MNEFIKWDEYLMVKLLIMKSSLIYNLTVHWPFSFCQIDQMCSIIVSQINKLQWRRINFISTLYTQMITVYN